MCAMNARARARTHTRTDERRPLSPGLTIFHYYYINKTFVDEDRDDDTPLYYIKCPNVPRWSQVIDGVKL